MSFIIKNPVDFRNNVRNKLEVVLNANGLIKPEKNQNKYALNLEIGIYNYCIKEADNKKIVKSWDNISFCQIYIDKLRSVYFNLNPPLIEKINSKIIKTQEIAFMTHQEFDESKWAELIDKKNKRDDSKFNKKIESSTNLFTCKKCSSKKCTYYELQIRSADEPATLFITCLDCGKNWKI
jgi:DNA-directed RNA polymerase subunit M/transcription elongation factor TFIIS